MLTFLGLVRLLKVFGTYLRETGMLQAWWGMLTSINILTYASISWELQVTPVRVSSLLGELIRTGQRHHSCLLWSFPSTIGSQKFYNIDRRRGLSFNTWRNLPTTFGDFFKRPKFSKSFGRFSKKVQGQDPKFWKRPRRGSTHLFSSQAPIQQTLVNL